VVRPVRPGGHGQAWDQLEAGRAEIEAQVKAGLSVVKIGVLTTAGVVKCVDAWTSGTANGTAVDSYDCNSTGAQEVDRGR
jgi:hypothetical protein